MNYDNPAARLLTLLESGKKISAGSTKCRDAWQQLLNVTNDDPLLMSRIGKVMELPQLVIQALGEAFPTGTPVATHWAERVNHAFMVQNLHEKWETFINHVDHHALNYLSISAELLQARTNTSLVPADNLITLRETFNTILSEILGSTAISPELQRYLARNLRKIIIHIDEYTLTGALPLLEGVEATIGPRCRRPRVQDISYRHGVRAASSRGAHCNGKSGDGRRGRAPVERSNRAIDSSPDVTSIALLTERAN